MKILVLGGTRFVGRVLVECLKSKNYQITTLNRGIQNDKIDSSIESLKADRTDSKAMKLALEKRSFDVVFDISGYTARDIQIVLDAMKDGIGHYIFCSSVAVCQQPPEYWPLTEDHPKCWSINDGEYSYNKWQAEEVLWNWCRKGHWKVTAVRPVYIYGPYNYRKRETFVFEKAISDLPIIVSGNGENILQFGYVYDLAEAMISMIDNSKAYGQAFNISGKESVTLTQFIKLAAKVVSKKVEVIYSENDSGDCIKLPSIHRFADISKARNVLGIESKTNLWTGLRKTASWWKKEKGYE